jgi:hypothetical protein
MIDFLKLALSVKADETQAYTTAFLPPFVLFAVMLLLFLGLTLEGIAIAVLSGIVMGGLAVVGLWFFTEAQIDGVLSVLDYSPAVKVRSESGVEKALARVTRVFAQKNLTQVPLSLSEYAYYSPKPFVAVLVKPAGSGSEAAIAFDTENPEARAIAQLLASSLRIK